MPHEANKAQATLTLAYHGLEIRSLTAGLSEDRPLEDKDIEFLESLAVRYQELTGQDHPAGGLLQLGQEIFAWLDGSTHVLTRILEAAQPPLLVEFVVNRQDENERARAFLDAPWELLAIGDQHGALRDDVVYYPVRRVGKTQSPPEPPPHRLSAVFMAAAPRGADNLSYEAEETSILTATKDIGLDLVVEESGTLDLLSACVARETPDVVQISCHGTLEPEPGLLLEDDIGNPDFVKASRLVSKLAAHHPRLLFLSACETAEANPVIDSLARSLVRSGAPGVLGWAAPVLDNEASLFAAGLYQRLTAGEDLAHALAYARLDLAQSEHLPEPVRDGPRSRDWHLARLYLSPTGGGSLATADGPRRLVGRGQAMKTFLDLKGKQVPVASEAEFVGRRREIQKILRAFRAPRQQRRAGVFIHGLGRQGKSSLAARVAHRLEHTHELIVIYGRYDARAMLAAFRDQLGTPAVTEIVDRYLPQVEADPARLLPALTELLEGPCEQIKPNADRHAASRPVLLAIDDFEQALEEQPTGNRHHLQVDFIEPIRAVIKAFNNAATESRLLFTCRYQFTLPDSGPDLADSLLDLPLHGMDAHEARKQATAKIRLQAEAGVHEPESLAWLAKLMEPIVSAAQGNPGLQDILFTLGLENPDACARCLQQMEAYQKTGRLPSEDKVRQYFENLAIETLLGLLAPAHRELLRSSTLFELPIPLPVLQLLSRHAAQPAGDEGIARLIALGLWEVYEDPHHRKQPSLAINTLVRPLAGTLTEAEQQTLAGVVSAALFDRWGGEAGGKRRDYLQDVELTRLALLARDPRVLAAATADALRFLDGQFEYQKAAEWAAQAVAVLDAGKVPASIDLLRTAAERCHRVGQVREANDYRRRALEAIQQTQARGEVVDPEHHAATLIAHARALAEQGRPDESLPCLEQAQMLLPPGPEQAIVIGEIARLRAAKGEVEAALELHQERLAVYEALGDKRSRAITLGDIARLRATKGEVDAALELHQQELAVYQALGDKRSRAATLCDIARLRADKGEVDAALESYEAVLAICDALGEKLGRAVTLGEIARLRADKGEVDAALGLHQEALAVFEALGDKRLRAVTLGDIARLWVHKGEVDAPLELHQEELAVYQALGDKDGIANALWSISNIQIRQEKFEEAFEHLARSYVILLQLGRLDGICSVGLDLGQILAAAGQREKALAILTRSRDGFEKLGWLDQVRQTQELMDKLTKPPT